MLYYLLALLLVLLDQGVKLWVRGNLSLGASVPLLPHIMDLTYVQNTGAAFSFLAGRDMTWLLALISLAATVLLAAAIARRFFRRPLGLLILSLLLAGAAGNLIDRALLGFVTDMFQTTFIHFAVFNVADICVTAGSVLLVIYVLFFERQDPPKGEEAPHDPHPTDC